MPEDQNQKREELLKRVRESLCRAESYAKKYRRLDVWLLVANIALGTLATVLAGGVAAGGQPGPGGWRLVCAIVAGFSAVGTICGTLHKTFHVTKRLAATIACIGRLKSFEFAITVIGKEPQAVAEAYEQILGEHPDCLA